MHDRYTQCGNHSRLARKQERCSPYNYMLWPKPKFALWAKWMPSTRCGHLHLSTSARCSQRVEDKRNALRAFSRCTQRAESIANAHNALRAVTSRILVWVITYTLTSGGPPPVPKNPPPVTGRESCFFFFFFFFFFFGRCIKINDRRRFHELMLTGPTTC